MNLAKRLDALDRAIDAPSAAARDRIAGAVLDAIDADVGA